MPRHINTDCYIDRINYMLYDDTCSVCRLCAFFAKKLFKHTVFISFECFYKHWYMFPNLIKNVDRSRVNLFRYASREWSYGEDAIIDMCNYNNVKPKLVLNIFRWATVLRQKCKKCKLSEE
jgi:hypothetical protein